MRTGAQMHCPAAAGVTKHARAKCGPAAASAASDSCGAASGGPREPANPAARSSAAPPRRAAAHAVAARCSGRLRRLGWRWCAVCMFETAQHDVSFVRARVELARRHQCTVETGPDAISRCLHFGRGTCPINYAKGAPLFPSWCQAVRTFERVTVLTATHESSARRSRGEASERRIAPKRSGSGCRRAGNHAAAPRQRCDRGYISAP